MQAFMRRGMYLSNCLSVYFSIYLSFSLSVNPPSWLPYVCLYISVYILNVYALYIIYKQDNEKENIMEKEGQDLSWTAESSSNVES